MNIAFCTEAAVFSQLQVPVSSHWAHHAGRAGGLRPICARVQPAGRRGPLGGGVACRLHERVARDDDAFIASSGNSAPQPHRSSSLSSARTYSLPLAAT